MAASPLPFDRDLHRRRLARAARAFDGADFLKRRAAEDLVERLGAIKRRFPTALDLGARNGAFARALAMDAARDGVDRLIEADLAAPMLGGRPGLRVVADEERLPFAVGCADLVVSSLAMHWVNDLVGALVQIRRILAPDGLFLGAVLGGSTLTELRQVCMEVDLDMTGGSAPRVCPFIDASDASSLLRRAGFAMPVVDVDRVVVRYDHAVRLMSDLRAMGETCALFERSRGALTREALARIGVLYAERFAGPEGKIPATFDIITLTGWAPHPDQPTPSRPAGALFGFDDAVRVAPRR